MKGFINEKNGSAPIWTAFLILILFTLSIVVYSAVTVYTKYQTCETELERAAIVTVDKNMENRNVRDLNLLIPQQPALADLQNNLILSGLAQSSGGTWKKFEEEKLLYELRDLNVIVQDEWVELSGLFVMPLPWGIGEQREIAIPIAARSKVIFLD